MEINLNIKKEELFNKWLMYLNPVLNLTEMERDVLAMYLYIICLNINAAKEKVSRKVFSARTRKLIRTKLGISEPSFNNYFSGLRKKGFIVKKDYGWDVVDKLKLEVGKSHSLKINFISK